MADPLPSGHEAKRFEDPARSFVSMAVVTLPITSTAVQFLQQLHHLDHT
jgi:hypothetical protein